MGVAANGPHPLSDIAPSAPLLTFLEITPGTAHNTKLFNSKMKCKKLKSAKAAKKIQTSSRIQIRIRIRSASLRALINRGD